MNMPGENRRAKSSNKTSTLLDRTLFLFCLLLPIPFLYWATSSGLIFANKNIWNEKMTVVVETPRGIIKASSVHRTGFSSGGFVLGSPDRRFLQGEAVVVEFPSVNGNPRYLFALLKGFSSYYQFHKKDFRDHYDIKAKKNRPAKKHPKDFLGHPPRTLPATSFPLFVTFEDINKPETIKRVDPNDLDAVFGLCSDGSGLRDINAPWRAEGVTWFAYARKELIRSRLVTAATEAGLEEEVANAWVEYKSLRAIRSSTRQELTDEQRRQLETLRARFKTGGKDAAEYVAAHKAMLKLPRFDASKLTRDASYDCNSVKAITVQVTEDEMVTGRVEQILEWLNTNDLKTLDGRRYHTIKAKNRLANNLTKGNFIRTSKKK